MAQIESISSQQRNGGIERRRNHGNRKYQHGVAYGISGSVNNQRAHQRLAARCASKGVDDNISRRIMASLRARIA
jgi:hypothetical protein